MGPVGGDGSNSTQTGTAVTITAASANGSSHATIAPPAFSLSLSSALTFPDLLLFAVVAFALATGVAFLLRIIWGG